MPPDIASALHLDDAEARMRQSLGIAAPSGVSSVAPSLDDPLKGARQAIRSQAAAREYAERQLAHAETTIQDLRRKLHDARRDKDAAVAAAQAAVAEKRTAERVLTATEAALTAEKTAHVSRITPFDGPVSTVFDGLPTSAFRSR
jgi:chromosome segregation ATPase